MAATVSVPHHSKQGPSGSDCWLPATMPVTSLGTKGNNEYWQCARVVPVAATMLAFPSIVHIPALKKKTIAVYTSIS